MHYKTAKGILSAKNGMNIYRGCTHVCIYCDSRSKCYGFDHDFEDIEIKENAPLLLERALKSKLDTYFPGLKNRYIKEYGTSYELDSPNSKMLFMHFKRKCKEHNIETDIGRIFEYLHTFESKEDNMQLSLF